MSDEPEDRLGMTEEQWECFKAHTRGFGEQDENGIDLSLLKENLRRTPTERLAQLQRAHSFFRRYENARNNRVP